MAIPWHHYYLPMPLYQNDLNLFNVQMPNALVLPMAPFNQKTPPQTSGSSPSTEGADRQVGDGASVAEAEAPRSLSVKRRRSDGRFRIVFFFPECVAKGSRLTWESEGRALFAGRCFRDRNRSQPFATVRNRPQVFESGSYGPAVGESSKK